LSVQNLSIMGSLNVKDIECLSTIQGAGLDLFLHCVAAEQMYQLLERMGQFVQTLYIGDSCESRQDIVNINSDVIVERILAACPNLDNFHFYSRRAVIQDNRYDLPPSDFKNYKQ
jgi:hypothetical protein